MANPYCYLFAPPLSARRHNDRFGAPSGNITEDRIHGDLRLMLDKDERTQPGGTF